MCLVAASLLRDVRPTTALKMRVGWLRVPVMGRGLPTDMMGRYADTTVSLPITKAACRITMICTRTDGV
jgi:hypothetical protein